MRPVSTVARLDVRVPARAASLPGIRRAIREFAAAQSLHDVETIALAVSEAASNAVLHAYPEGQSGEVRVVCCVEPERVVVVVRDWGMGMRPRHDTPGLGLGLPTIATLGGAFNVEAAEGRGTLLRMHFPRD
jgi:anti-sigma regulatory factor (Ser/Thr protein kinase)